MPRRGNSPASFLSGSNASEKLSWQHKNWTTLRSLFERKIFSFQVVKKKKKYIVHFFNALRSNYRAYVMENYQKREEKAWVTAAQSLIVVPESNQFRVYS